MSSFKCMLGLRKLVCTLPSNLSVNKRRVLRMDEELYLLQGVLPFVCLIVM